ncbi:unnamed protein product [Rhizophagus irregularis]|nr:unnamed protein product [Rhizophagus irregularis]
MSVEINIPRTNSPQFIDSDDESDSDVESFMVKPFLTLEEGIKAHNEKKYDIAWECFVAQSKIDNPKAKYWKAYYLYNGRNGVKDVDEAIKLYKEAAEDDVSEASFQYAVCILKHQQYFNKEDYEKYLRKAADHKHIDAQFHLAELYIRGKFEIEKNSEEGIKYLKLAALENHFKAWDLVMELKINVYE